MSVHNLVIGNMYLDVGGKGFVRNMACPKEQFVEIDFFKRGWSAESYHRFSGQVFSAQGQVAYRLEGKWNQSITMTDVKTGVKELIWTKTPY